MCECCSGGKNADKYKKFAFLNSPEHNHEQDHSQEHVHGHDITGGFKITPVGIPKKKSSEQP